MRISLDYLKTHNIEADVLSIAFIESNDMVDTTKTKH
jgi:hypothetical protein